MAKVDPLALQQQQRLPPASNFPEFPNEPFPQPDPGFGTDLRSIPGFLLPTPEIRDMEYRPGRDYFPEDINAIDNSSFQPLPNYGNNGQPGLFNGNAVDNSSFTPYNGQFDLSGMTGQPAQNMSQMGQQRQGSSSGGKSMGSSSSGYGGGKSR
jgi:hypothetical protein